MKSEVQLCNTFQIANIQNRWIDSVILQVWPKGKRIFPCKLHLLGFNFLLPYDTTDWVGSEVTWHIAWSGLYSYQGCASYSLQGLNSHFLLWWFVLQTFPGRWKRILCKRGRSFLAGCLGRNLQQQVINTGKLTFWHDVPSADSERLYANRKRE